MVSVSSQVVDLELYFPHLTFTWSTKWCLSYWTLWSNMLNSSTMIYNIKLKEQSYYASLNPCIFIFPYLYILSWDIHEHCINTHLYYVPLPFIVVPSLVIYSMCTTLIYLVHFFDIILLYISITYYYNHFKHFFVILLTCMLSTLCNLIFILHDCHATSTMKSIYIWFFLYIYFFLN